MVVCEPTCGEDQKKTGMPMPRDKGSTISLEKVWYKLEAISCPIVNCGCQKTWMDKGDLNRLSDVAKF